MIEESRNPGKDVSDEWKEHPYKLRRKDMDVQWAKKNQEAHHRCKDIV